MKRWKITFFVIVVATFAFNNCSDRLETTTLEISSTTVYPSKSVNGIDANITFCEKISKKMGNPINPGNVFSIKENEKVTAVINLRNREYHRNRELMFHIDWLDSSKNSLFKKRIDLPEKDSTTVLVSSINISPDKRLPGNYCLRVYLFRELIAEKKFELLPYVIDSAKIISEEMVRKITPTISLGSKISKKTGKLLDDGTSFTIKKKAKIYASVYFENIELYSKQPKNFYVDWIGPDSSSFFRKKVELAPGDSIYSISSSITISPQKRIPGNYLVRIYLFEELIGEKKFSLQNATIK